MEPGRGKVCGMTSGYCLNRKISSGLARVAALTGTKMAHYRGQKSSDPIGNGYIDDVGCFFNISASLDSSSPLIWGKSMLFAAVDGPDIQCGDYLVQPEDVHGYSEKYFIARIESGKPLLVVLTNEIISFFESDLSADNKTFGLRPAEGPVWGRDQSIAALWPVSMLKKNGGGKPATRLGTDLPGSGFEILMPRIPNTYIRRGLRIRNSHGECFHIWSVEETSFGYRLSVIADQL